LEELGRLLASLRSRIAPPPFETARAAAATAAAWAWDLEADLYALQAGVRELHGAALAADDTERLVGLLLAMLHAQPLVRVPPAPLGIDAHRHHQQRHHPVVVCFLCKHQTPAAGDGCCTVGALHAPSCCSAIVSKLIRPAAGAGVTSTLRSAGSDACPKCGASARRATGPGRAVLCVCGCYWQTNSGGGSGDGGVGGGCGGAAARAASTAAAAAAAAAATFEEALATGVTG
jgi:hypothetical protein